MRPITNSELSTWRRCHRKWWLSYERGLKPIHDEPDDGSARATGTRVHMALMHLQRDQRDAMWAELEGDDLATIMVEGYLQYLEEEGPDAGVTWTDTERVVTADIGDGMVLAGKVDRRGVDADGRWFVDDYKTVGAMDQFNAWAVMQTQPKHYMTITMLNNECTPEWGGRFRYTLLRRVKRTPRAKPPFYGTKDVYHTQRELEAYLHMVFDVVEEMEVERRTLDESAEYVPYPNPTRDCRWECPFFGVCPMIDSDPEGAEIVIQLGFRRGDPLEHHKEEGINEV